MILKIIIGFVFFFTFFSYNSAQAGVCDDGCCAKTCVMTACNPVVGCSGASTCTWVDCACNQTFSYQGGGGCYLQKDYCDTPKCKTVPKTTCTTKNVKVCGCAELINNPNTDKNNAAYALCKQVCWYEKQTTCTTSNVEDCNSKYGCDVWHYACNYIASGTQTGVCSGPSNPPVNPPAPTCTAQGACTPTCPAGTVNYNTGLAAANGTCSYQSGGTNANGTCTQTTLSTPCWTPVVNTPPVVTVTSPGTASSLGCVASNGNVGLESNNSTQFSFTYDDSLVATNPNQALQVWFSTTNTPTLATATNKIYDTGTGQIKAGNSGFGILVRKDVTGWTNIYIPGQEAGINTWVKGGTVGAGLRAEILGNSGGKAVGIKDVSVTTASNKNTLTFNLVFYNQLSGITPYEKIADGTYYIYGTVNKQLTFLPSGGNTIASISSWLNTNQTINIDLNAPTADALSYTASGVNGLNLLWKFSDSFSPIIRSIGDSTRLSAGTTQSNIADTTSGSLNYVLGSGATGNNLYNGTPHLWTVNNLATRTDTIDLKTNEGGNIQFTTYGFDRSCNSVSTSSSIPLGSAWMTTRGGMLYSYSGASFIISSFNTHTGFSADAYWTGQFPFYKDEADVSTELLSASNTNVNSLLYPSKGGTINTNHFDSNNKSGYWYQEFLSRSVNEVTSSPTSFNVINYSSSKSISANTTSTQLTNGSVTCTAAKRCIVNVTGDLTVNSGFVCDAKTMFLVSGKVRIEPDLTTTSLSNGCMFIAAGDITIGDGTYKSGASAYPVYDIVAAYLLSDSQIIMPLSDVAQSVRDGLLIRGSVLGFGNTLGQSVVLGRSLKMLHNQSYPSVAVHFDNRYYNMSQQFVGGDNKGFKSEVGFKPL